jgi:glycosyltransferase involved in cell wall biosynthesis
MRILGFIALSYSDQGGFWYRDLGLLIRRLREMGHDAWLVAFKKEGDLPGGDWPVIVATQEDLADPAWWRKQAPEALILNAWSAPRWHAIRRAATSLGVPTVEKLDTDGVKSPRIWFRSALELSWHVNADLTDPLWKRSLMVVKETAKVLLVRCIPAVMDARMIRTMSLVPVYAAETPLAAARVRRFLTTFGASPMPRVVTIPHPVNTQFMGYQPGDVKEKLVVAVGRWRAVNKGWPMFFAVAKRFLKLCPDWKIVVVGPPPALDKADRRDVEALGSRLQLVGMRTPEEMAALYRRARIYLLPSTWESFNIAAAEALCCGCAVVGPGQLASVNYFASFRSGTVSHLRDVAHLTDAMMAEVGEWETGQRDPGAISKTAIDLFSVDSIAEKFLTIFRDWPPSKPK